MQTAGSSPLLAGRESRFAPLYLIKYTMPKDRLSGPSLCIYLLRVAQPPLGQRNEGDGAFARYSQA